MSIYSSRAPSPFTLKFLCAGTWKWFLCQSKHVLKGVPLGVCQQSKASLVSWKMMAKGEGKMPYGLSSCAFVLVSMMAQSLSLVSWKSCGIVWRRNSFSYCLVLDPVMWQKSQLPSVVLSLVNATDVNVRKCLLICIQWLIFSAFVFIKQNDKKTWPEIQWTHDIGNDWTVTLKKYTSSWRRDSKPSAVSLSLGKHIFSSQPFPISSLGTDFSMHFLKTSYSGEEGGITNTCEDYVQVLFKLLCNRSLRQWGFSLTRTRMICVCVCLFSFCIWHSRWLVENNGRNLKSTLVLPLLLQLQLYCRCCFHCS